MTRKRPMARVSNGVEPAFSLSLLETLSESRISILQFARKSKEAQNDVLAEELTAQGQVLRLEISRIRQTVTPEWNKKTKLLIARAGTAQSELSKLIHEADKSEKKTRIFTRALGAVSNILALAKKVI
ncbi:MAG: hypothetical protein JNK54_08300 [Elusimicrobia bacterium]|jgi:hypothetical protein|nr:hypothetical protein [Elusimicrobiota bacterium]